MTTARARARPNSASRAETHSLDRFAGRSCAVTIQLRNSKSESSWKLVYSTTHSSNFQLDSAASVDAAGRVPGLRAARPCADSRTRSNWPTSPSTGNIPLVTPLSGAAYHARASPRLRYASISHSIVATLVTFPRCRITRVTTGSPQMKDKRSARTYATSSVSVARRRMSSKSYGALAATSARAAATSSHTSTSSRVRVSSNSRSRGSAARADAIFFVCAAARRGARRRSQ